MRNLMPPLKNKLSSGYILVIDPSSEHLGYTVSKLDNNHLVIEDIGVLWTKSAWDRGERFTYMANAIQSFINDPRGIVECVSEAFFSNPKMMMGSSVIPIINGIIEMEIFKSGKPITYQEVPPTVWRKTLSIKPAMVNGKRDYKTPTKDKVEELLVFKFPDNIISNITGKDRQLPTDVPDVVAITLAAAIDSGANKLEISNDLVYNRLGTLIKERYDSEN